MYFSMETAIGVMAAHTTALGRTADSIVVRMNQNTSWLLRLLPMSIRNMEAILLSSPVTSQEAVIMEAPSKSRIISSA